MFRFFWVTAAYKLQYHIWVPWPSWEECMDTIFNLNMKNDVFNILLVIPCEYIYHLVTLPEWGIYVIMSGYSLLWSELMHLCHYRIIYHSRLEPTFNIHVLFLLGHYTTSSSSLFQGTSRIHLMPNYILLCETCNKLLFHYNSIQPVAGNFEKMGKRSPGKD